MSESIASARSHPAAVASWVAAGIAVTACALVAIAYMLGWVPASGKLPAAPTAIATPGMQVAGSAPEVALLPGETLVTESEVPRPSAPAPSALSPATPAAPSTPRYSRSVEPKVAAPEPASPAPRKPAPPIYPPAPPPSSSTSYAQILPPRAAPAKPAYRPDPPAYTSYERAARELCVNCGVISSIGSTGPDWEVRVRFEDGSSETLRYPERPRFRVGQRVHLEDGRLVAE